MTWTLNVYFSGHVDAAEEEKEILEQLRAKVSELPGSGSAVFSGMHSGSVDLTNLAPPAPSTEATTEGPSTEAT